MAAQEIKTCPKCGKNISATAKICPHCNADAFACDTRRAYSEIEDMDSNSVYMPAKRRKKRGLILMIFLIAVAIFYYFNGGENINFPN